MSETVSTADLCVHCGLCCTEALFGWIPLVDPAERDRVATHGMAPPQLEGERFVTPCCFVRDRACTIYADRPASCRDFRCEVLVSAQDGAIPLPAALDTVRKAVELHQAVLDKLPADTSLRAMRQRWKEREATAQPSSPEEAQLRLAYYALNLFLDRHFRPADGELVERLD
ncbi:MAG: YkgJ family cysteine cluster protein [Sphingomonadaceae bacterium]|nr:YkgJ family cysteine cluster protein [Sphingomonadaceae bacterium]